MQIILRNTQGVVKPSFAYHAMAGNSHVCNLRGMLIRLAEFRDKQGIGQEEMAARLEVSTSQISRWESGKNNIPSLRLPELAEAYGCRIGEIFDYGMSLPNARELEQMLQSAMSELSVGVSFADFPNAVASGLHDRLRRFAASGGFRRTEDEASTPGTAGLSPPPTKRASPAKPRRS